MTIWQLAMIISPTCEVLFPIPSMGVVYIFTYMETIKINQMVGKYTYHNYMDPTGYSSSEDTNKTPLMSVDANDGGTLPASELEAFSVPKEISIFGREEHSHACSLDVFR